jgi:hypothetical protein
MPWRTGSSYSSRSSMVGSAASMSASVAKALHPHGLEVPVGHRVADQRHPVSGVHQQAPDPAAGLALARPGPRRAHGHHRSRAAQRGRPWSEQPEVRARGHRDRRAVHDLDVRQVRVGQHDLVDAVLGDELRQPLLVDDRDAVGVPRSGEARGVGPAGDARDLRRRERHDGHPRGVTVHDVEVVEVPDARTHDHDRPHLRPPGRAGRSPRSPWNQTPASPTAPQQVQGPAAPRRSTRSGAGGRSVVAPRRAVRPGRTAPGGAPSSGNGGDTAMPGRGR